ncbi:MAG TPA: MurR/RpiR family transcriptional regulator [Dongiaceae bacterium]|nr:MurR/RpiR family transcriptional regulator [Dongiaceae bacterium]
MGLTKLEQRFQKAGVRLNANRKKFLAAILANPDDTFFLSSRQLARRYNVDAATIVRTIQVLGYKKFSEFAADLRSHFVTRITPYTILKAASREKQSLPERIRHSLEMDGRNLQHLQSNLVAERIVALAKAINRSNRILVVGIDLAASLSWHLAYGLMSMGFAAEAPVGSSGNIQRRVRTLTTEDLLVAISFGQCLRETVEAAIHAKELKVPTFGITDSEKSPIARVCANSYVVSVASPSFVGSYVAPMAMLGTVLVAAAHLQTSRSLQILKRSEEQDRSGRRWYRAVEEFQSTGE